MEVPAAAHFRYGYTMHVNAGPWARMLREMSVPWLFVLGVVLPAVSYGALYLTLDVLPALRPLLPIFALGGGIGLAALLAAVFRLIWAGGRTVRAVAAVVLGIAAVCGSVAWYSVSVVQANVWYACSRARSEREQAPRDAALAEGKAGMKSFFFGVARLVREDRSVVERCAYADTDDARRALGLCPRVIDSDTPCRCESSHYPRDMQCRPATCDARDGYTSLRCGAPPSAPTGPDLAALSIPDRWRARLGLDDLVGAEPVRLDKDYALRLTLRGAAPDDLEALRERGRALYVKAAPYLTREIPVDWTGMLVGGRVALIVVYEEGGARAVTAHDERLGKAATRVDACGVALQDRSLYAIEINPATEVSFEPEKKVTCKGTVMNLGESPIDLAVECQPDESRGEKPASGKAPQEKVSLKPGAKASYAVHPAGKSGLDFRHVYRERGKDDAPPLEAFNRFAYDHGQDWISLHERLHRSVGVRFHNPYASLAPSHADYGQPNLALPDGWEDMDAKKREQMGKEIWKAMIAHYRKWHSAESSAVHLFAGDKEVWVIDGGKLRRTGASP